MLLAMHRPHLDGLHLLSVFLFPACCPCLLHHFLSITLDTLWSDEMHRQHLLAVSIEFMVSNTSPQEVAGCLESLCGVAAISVYAPHASLRNRIHHSLSQSSTPIAAVIVILVVGPLSFSRWFESVTLTAHWSAQQGPHAPNAEGLAAKQSVFIRLLLPSGVVTLWGMSAATPSTSVFPVRICTAYRFSLGSNTQHELLPPSMPSSSGIASL